MAKIGLAPVSHHPLLRGQPLTLLHRFVRVWVGLGVAHAHRLTPASLPFVLVQIRASRSPGLFLWECCFIVVFGNHGLEECSRFVAVGCAGLHLLHVW